MNKTKAVAAIIGIVILDAIALYNGIDGVMFMTCVAIISGLGGYPIVKGAVENYETIGEAIRGYKGNRGNFL